MNDIDLMKLARAFDREDAAQRGEPDPWLSGGEDDDVWVTERISCARAAVEAVNPVKSEPSLDIAELIDRAKRAMESHRDLMGSLTTALIRVSRERDALQQEADHAHGGSRQLR